MPAYTNNLNLIKPYESNYFNINTWNANMNILDDAYATMNSRVIDIESTEDEQHNNVYTINKSGIFHISVTANTIINFPSYDLIHVVLAFDTTVYDVSWVKSVESASNIIWDAGAEPVWDASSVYEVSILHGHAMVFKRNNMTPSATNS